MDIEYGKIKTADFVFNYKYNNRKEWQENNACSVRYGHSFPGKICNASEVFFFSVTIYYNWIMIIMHSISLEACCIKVSVRISLENLKK